MSRLLAATTWSAADLFLRHGLQFVVVVVLARLLTPSEFGTVALLTLFTGVAAVVVTEGLSTALIQRQDIKPVDESTAFWSSVILGVVLAGGMAAAGPLIADFYSSPVLVPLSVVMAISILVNSLAATHVAVLTKALNFRPILQSGAIASVVSGGIAVALALLGFGVWALAAHTLAMGVVTTVMLWLLHDWRPRWEFNRESARRLLGFGGFVLGAALLDVLYTRLYTVLAGRLFGLREVGLYQRGLSSQQLPAELLSTIVGRVTLPLLSSKQSSITQLRQGTRRAIRMLMVVNAPVMLGLAALAEPFIVGVFGPQWVSAASLLEVLCIGGLLWPMHLFNLQALLAQGRGRLYLGLDVAKKAVGVTLLVVGAVSFGLIGMAWGQVVFAVFALGVNTYYTRRFLSYGFLSQLRDVLPGILLAIPIAVATRVVADHWQGDALVVTAVLSASGAVAYIAAAWALRLSALDDIHRALLGPRDVGKGVAA